MTLPRITNGQAAEVNRLRKAGRTDRQIERIVGLTYGLLSKPYRVGEDPRPILDREIRGTVWVYPARTETEPK